MTTTSSERATAWPFPLPETEAAEARVAYAKVEGHLGNRSRKELGLPLAAMTLLLRKNRPGSPFVLGVSGPPGSGKSTLTLELGEVLGATGLKVATLSLDDLYLSRRARERKAKELHPLFMTRGVPGTHDVDLGLELFAALRAANAETKLALPRFDKGRDDLRPREEWPLFRGRPDVILFDGWCLGVLPVEEATLEAPLNDLERTRDPDGTWRRAVNRFLRSEYAPLFDRPDLRVDFLAPSWKAVLRFREEQEAELLAKRKEEDRPLALPQGKVEEFLAHFQRLAERPPERASALNLRVRVGEGRETLGIESANPALAP